LLRGKGDSHHVVSLSGVYSGLYFIEGCIVNEWMNEWASVCDVLIKMIDDNTFVRRGRKLEETERGKGAFRWIEIASQHAWKIPWWLSFVEGEILILI
jgi:hypothetical protein